MDYNSVQEILDAGTSNMTVIRNNVRNDDGTDTLTGVNWFKFNNYIASNIYVSGNSWFGFGSNTEHLRVNRRDCADYYVYREEGTLYGLYKFLKIRWSGFSVYSQTGDNYKTEYDVILWDSGNISLHMIHIPTTNYDGNFNIVTNTTLNYTKPTTNSVDVTFYAQDSSGISFVAQNELITIYPPFDRKFLIKEGDEVFTIQNDALVSLGEVSITSTLFQSDGFDDVPDGSILLTLENPEVLHWIEDDSFEIGILTATETAIPPLQVLVSPDYDMTDETILGIENVEAEASSDVMFAVSFDEGTTWKMYDGTQWIVLTQSSSGMSASTVNGITTEQWNSVAITGKFRFRIVIPDETETFTSLVVNYIN